MKIPEHYEDLLIFCDDCGKKRPLNKVEAAGHVSYLCDSCLEALYDYCQQSLGFECEGCLNVHDDYKLKKDDKIGAEYLVCGFCGHMTEIESYDPDDDDFERMTKHWELETELVENIEKIKEKKKK